MPDPSTTDKFRAISRVLGRQAGQSRLSRAGYQAGRGFLSSAKAAMSALFHQVSGLFFLLFGVVVGYGAVREYRVYAAGEAGPGKAILGAVLAVMFLYFAISAFIRAGRKK